MALDSLRTEKEFRKVRNHGAVVRHALFTLRVTEYRPRYGERWQPRAIVGIVVSKKTLKHAVKRNRVRRRTREALRTLPVGLAACRAILFPTAAVLDVPFEELQVALAKALAQGLAQPARGKGGSKRTGQPKGSPTKGVHVKEAKPTAGQNGTESKKALTSPLPPSSTLEQEEM